MTESMKGPLEVTVCRLLKVTPELCEVKGEEQLWRGQMLMEGINTLQQGQNTHSSSTAKPTAENKEKDR